MIKTKQIVEAIEETPTGRNIVFKDIITGKIMTRSKFVKEIENGNYPNYHVREINGVKTPCANPDENSTNNLN